MAKLTESYLRKIIRGAINEMMSATGDDMTAMGTVLDNPFAQQPSEVPSQEVVDKILDAFAAGKIPPALVSQLLAAAERENNPAPPESDPFSYMGESRKRK
jgi:hypothetical protein